MFKNILLGLTTVMLLTSPALADFKYKERIQVGDEISVQSVFIKGQKERIDLHANNTSEIILCESNQKILLNHNRRTYKSVPISHEFVKRGLACSAEQQILPSPGTEINAKVNIKETQESEILDNINTKKYLVTTDIMGDPSCVPNIKTKTTVWAADIEEDSLSCSVLDKVKKCNYIPPLTGPCCIKNIGIINYGLEEVPGFAVKEEIMYYINQNPASSNYSSKKVITRSKFSNEPLPLYLFEIPIGYKNLDAYDASRKNSMKFDLEQNMTQDGMF